MLKVLTINLVVTIEWWSDSLLIWIFPYDKKLIGCWVLISYFLGLLLYRYIFLGLHFLSISPWFPTSSFPCHVIPMDSAHITNMPIKIKFIGPLACFSYPGEKMVQGNLEHLWWWWWWFWSSSSSSKPAPIKGIPLWYWLPILSGCIIMFNRPVVFSTHKASVSNVNLLYVLYNLWRNQSQGCWTWLISPLNILLTSHILWCLIQRNYFYPAIVASLLLLL